VRLYLRGMPQRKQGNRRLHFAIAVHSRHPFPPMGDAAHRQHAGGGPSHGHRQHTKVGKDRACGSGDILADRQTYTQTDILITALRNRSRGRSSLTISVTSYCAVFLWSPYVIRQTIIFSCCGFFFFFFLLSFFSSPTYM